MNNKYKERTENLLSKIYPKHNPKPSISLRPFRTIHTGIVVDPDAAKFEFKRPIVMDLRKENFYTTHLIINHVLHISKVLEARNIHLKYVELSGDTYVLFRTKAGLIPYSTINNKHWIKYIMMHATGSEDPEKIGEGEFRLEVISLKDGRMEFTVNLIYIQGGIKLTLAPVS